MPAALHVRHYGAGSPLLLIHGLGSSGDDWAFQIGPLAQQHHLIVPDLRGCGQSPASAVQPSIAGYATDLWTLLDGLQIAHINIAGFSMGGAVALEMALQRPSAVVNLVTINSLPSYRIDHWRKWLELNLQIALIHVLGMRRMARLAARRLFPHPQHAAMRQRVIDVVGPQSPDAYLRCARALADWCAAERISALRARTLMIAGEHDYTPLAEKRQWAARMHAQLCIVRGSRHGTPFDAIGASNQCLLSFLAGKPVPAELAMDPADAVPDGPPVLPPQRPQVDAAAAVFVRNF